MSCECIRATQNVYVGVSKFSTRRKLALVELKKPSFLSKAKRFTQDLNMSPAFIACSAFRKLKPAVAFTLPRLPSPCFPKLKKLTLRSTRKTCASTRFAHPARADNQ